ncbi:glycosyltransferase (plasmid) [Segnochrobactraceae bacterium EtOH-i3]
MQGRILNLKSRLLRAWAWNPAQPLVPLRVMLSVDETEIPPTLAQAQAASDASADFPGGAHGLRQQLPVSLFPTKKAVVRKVILYAMELNGTRTQLHERRITFPPRETLIEGELERFSRGHVHGWARHPWDPKTPVTVRLLQGERVIVSAVANLSTSKAAPKKEEPCGFDLAIPDKMWLELKPSERLEVRADTGDFIGSLKLAEAAVVWSLLQIVRAAERSGASESAVAAIERILQWQPDSVDALWARARLAFSGEDIQTAIDYCERVRAIEPSYGPAISLLARIAHSEGRCTDAIRLWEQLPPKTPIYRDGLLRRSQTLRDIGRAWEAIPVIQEMLALDGDDIEAHLIGGQIYRELHLTTLARRHFKRASELKPDDRQISEQLKSVSRIARPPSSWAPELSGDKALEAWIGVMSGQSDPNIIYSLISESGYFDADWYLKQHPEAGINGSDPLIHYINIGGLKNFDPSPLFDTRYYIEQCAGEKLKQTIPLVDFLTWGGQKGRKARRNQGQAALVVHAFHLDVLPDLSQYASNFPSGFDQYVTCPDSFSEEDISRITSALPRAKIVQVPNTGHDIGAMVELDRAVDLTRYDILCKIHSKKGENEPDRWRHALLRGMLGTASQAEKVIDVFNRDPKLILAGASQLYVSGPHYMWQKDNLIGKLFPGIVEKFDYLKESWGFIHGTCFWIRGSIFADIRDAIASIDATEAKGVDEHTLNHSAERLFGMTAALKKGNVMLCDVSIPDKIKIVPARLPVPGAREQDSITDLLRKIVFPEALVRKWTPRGAINGTNATFVRGWLALVGDERARQGILQIGPHRIPFVAARFRTDLKNHGINQGWHAFQVSVPGSVCDGLPHEVVLIDELTGTEIARKTFTWTKPKREYWDFQGFLKSSMTQPEIFCPFVEEDKRAFAVMENIANRMARKGVAAEPQPLVSIIMPMFNRAGIVGEAIASVLTQTYPHFELIVVDDGSSDNSVQVVRGIDDARIRLIELEENSGVTVARNTALRAAKGDFIAYLDSDNTWDIRFLAAHVGAFLDLPEADMIYSGVLLYSGNTTEPYAIRYGHLHRSLLENRNYIDNNIIFHRRDFLDKIIGFDESLRRYVDWDLILRATEVGRVYSVPMLLCNYYYSRTDNAITDDARHIGHLDILREKFELRQKERLTELDRRDLVRPVSVIIPNWQSLDDIRDCIDALHQRSWNGMLDIIVVDNDSSAAVKEYLRSESEIGRIKFIPLDMNYGFTYAVNRGIEISRPDSDILLLNNDAIAQPGAVQRLQEVCLSQPNAGMTVPRQILPAGTKTLRTHVPYATETRNCDVNISSHHRNLTNVPVFHDGGVLEMNYAPFFAVYIKRELIEDIGPLDAEYGRHYRSDRVYSDMMRNMTHYRMFYVPDSYFIHKLQKATDHLREVGKTDDSFDLMFKRNQWDKDTAKEMNFRFPPWDIF